MKKFLFFLFFFAYSSMGFGQQIKTNESKVLIVVSSYGKDTGKLRPGFELDEFTQAYWIFKDNNIEVEVASPKGGKVEFDEFNPKKPYNKRFLEDITAQKLLSNTTPTANLVNTYYDAVYVVGGKGAMFDLPVDPSLQDIIIKIHKKNGVIASVCHGSAAFVNIKIDKDFMVKNKEIAGFCNTEEEKFGKKWVKEFPYLLETKLIERGALYKKGEDMLPFVVTSDKFVTGQNPYSTTLVAEGILKAMGKMPKPRQPYKDENSMFLVKRALDGEIQWAKDEIEKRQTEYDLQLIAVYGYYGLLSAKEDKQALQKGLSIIELAAPHFFNENLHLERANAHKKLGEKEKAITLLKELISKNLLVEEANKLLKELN
jgi:putative intracellular protease/amidase